MEQVPIVESNAVSLTLRVRYAETDQMGIVHHSNYLIWFEAGRSEFCRVRGIDYRQMEANGLILPLVECHCRFISPAFYEDEVVVTTRVITLKRSFLQLGYEVKRADTLLVTGETRQLLVSRSDRKPKSFPAGIASLFLSAGT